MKNIQAASNRNSNAATVAVEELRTMRSRIDSLNTTLNELENKNAALSVSKIILICVSVNNDDFLTCRFKKIRKLVY